jgi:tetratricopeptide (TPR) repeat protein
VAKLSELKAQAEALEAAGRHDQALRIYEHVLKHLEGTDAIEREFPLYVKAGDALAAVDRTAEALDRYRAAATRYAKQGSAEGIIELCTKIQAVDSTQSTVHFALAGALLDNGHAEAARLVLVDFAERTNRQKMAQGLGQLEGRAFDKVTVVLRKAIDTGLGRASAPAAPPPVAETPPEPPPAEETVEEPEDAAEPESSAEEPSSAAPAAADDETEDAAPDDATEEPTAVDNGLVFLTSASDDAVAEEHADDAVAEEPADEPAEPEVGAAERVQSEATPDAGFVVEHGATEPEVVDESPDPVEEEPEPAEPEVEPEAARPSSDRAPAPWDRPQEPRVVVRDDEPKKRKKAAKRPWLVPVAVVVVLAGAGGALVAFDVISLGGGDDGGAQIGPPPVAAPLPAPAQEDAALDSAAADSGAVDAEGLAALDSVAADETSVSETPLGAADDSVAAGDEEPTESETPEEAGEEPSEDDTTTVIPPAPALPEVVPAEEPAEEPAEDPAEEPASAQPPVAAVEIIAIDGLDIDGEVRTANGWQLGQTLATGEVVTLTVVSGDAAAPDGIVDVRTDAESGQTIGEADHSGYRVTIRGTISEVLMRDLLQRLGARPRSN